MKYSLLMFSLVFFSTMVSAESDELISFSNGTIADADDVNHNFQLLLKQAEELKSRSKTIIVDCTDNPAALREAYNRNFEKRSLNFEIKGSCYANFANEGAPDYRNIMINHQQIMIDGLSDATLIPDEQGIIGLVASFGGGLHLYNLDINVPSDYDRWVILFSRNGYGTVSNVNITGGSTNPGIIRSQRSANVYIHNTNIVTKTHGVMTENGGSIAFFGENSITSTNGTSLYLGEGATISNYSELSIEGRIDLKPGSTLASSGLLKFDHIFADGASLKVRNSSFTGENTEINFRYSTGYFSFTEIHKNSFDSLTVLLVASKMRMEGAHDDNNPVTVQKLSLDLGSSLNIDGALRFKNITANGSIITFSHFDETYSEAKYNLVNSQASIYDKPLDSVEHLSVFQCKGLSILYDYGKKWTSEVTNCRSTDDW